MESTRRVHVLLKINPLGSLLHGKSVLSSLNGTEHQQTLSVICGFSDQQLSFDALFLQANTRLFRGKVVMGFFSSPIPFYILTLLKRGPTPYVTGLYVCAHACACVHVCARTPTFITLFKKNKPKDSSLTATKHFVPFNIRIQLFLRYARLYLAESIFKVLICNGPQLAGHNG